MTKAFDIAQLFSFPSAVNKVDAFGNGIINDTYIVTFSDPASSGHPRLGKRAILQRINPDVFPDPPAIMHNLTIVLEHAAKKSDQMLPGFLLPPIYRSKQDAASVRDELGNHWRAIGFIEQTKTSDVLESTAQAEQAGAALGAFHQILSDLPVEKLKDTLPGFHDTPGYLRQYDAAMSQWDVNTKQNLDNAEPFQQNSLFKNENELARSLNECQEQIEKHRSLAKLLIGARPAINTGIMHGDPKLNNILFDKDSGKAISIIDLDTVKPGYIHYDIGDCIRSCCNSAGEMPTELGSVHFSTENFAAILHGYLNTAIELLTEQDINMLFDIVRLLPFELGIRFFTDYLNGNRYFKVQSRYDNLYRAQTQFHLLKSIEEQERGIRKIISQSLNRSGQ